MSEDVKQEKVLNVPQLSLVVLVGVSGSGKSTFAAEHFGAYETVSSDDCRGWVANDPNDQAATDDAFALLHHLVGVRLRRGLLTVVDATNVQRESRAQLIKVARDHDVLPVAIVLDVGERTALDRNRTRPDRQFGDHVVRRQRAQLRSGLRGLAREGFRTVHVLHGEAEISAASVVRQPLYNDRTDLMGPFDVIGDVHGCRSELESLLDQLGYRLHRDDQGRPVDAEPPAGRTAVFVGDLVDRGPDTPGVLRLVMGMVAAGHALCVSGNHEAKLLRALNGRQVQRSHGLSETLTQLEAEGPELTEQVRAWCDGLVSHYTLDGGALVVAHAGLKESYHGRASGRVRSFALYGDTTGETDEYGLPVRLPWAREYRGRATVLYGHTPTLDPEWINNTMCVDTGCVFGGQLSALRYPEREVVQVPAEREWYAPTRPLEPATPAPTAREDDQLMITDVLDETGRGGVETRFLGRVSLREGQARAALEVISRYALHPRWLPYLPPTMAPVATSGSPAHLEHPAEAFSAYAADGIDQVICEEKHMGSRAVLLVCADAAAAARRFGSSSGETGAVYTRTGRSFFTPTLTETLLERVRTAVGAAGLWSELDTDWVLLDAEILPWSAKAAGLLHDQYAAVGAAARAMFPPTLAGLRAAGDRGVDVTELLDRAAARSVNADAFTAAYRRYCWDVDGLDGVQVAPFQLLATAGATHHERDHGWHLGIADRLVAADPGLFRPTRRQLVELGSTESTEAATQWWTELTWAGGEGMVVKPYAGYVRTGRVPVQPGLKVRGAEYLRIIYGPDYLEPGNLIRLKRRNVGGQAWTGHP